MVIGLIMLISFGPNLLPLELITVIACFLQLCSPWHSKRRGGGGRGRVGGLPTAASTYAFVHYSQNKFLLQEKNK